MLRLVEHALAAPDHRRSPIFDDDDALAAGPSLIWCNDDGNYLMSSGVPALTTRNHPKRSKTVQAHGGLGRAGSRECLGSAVGGSHFAEFLPLTDGQWWAQGGTTFAEAIRASYASGLKHLMLTVTDMDYDTGEPGSMSIWFR